MARAYVPPHRRSSGLRSPVSLAPRAIDYEQKFDPENGQVYSEIEIVVGKKRNLDWIKDLKTPSIRSKPPRAIRGVRSLQAIAASKCVTEFRSFAPEHFEHVPWSLGEDLWEESVHTHTESFHMWRTLAATYSKPEEFGQPDYRYHLEFKQPPLPLAEYFRGIDSIDACWLSAVRISPKQTSIPDLVSIANIKNLAVLDLSDGQVLTETMPPIFDERIIRTWAELAARGRAFKHLQVMMLGWQENVSDWLFKYLRHFPRLQHLVVTDCSYMHQKNRADWEESANSYGWMAHHAKRSVKMLRPLLDDPQFPVTAVSKLYYDAVESLATMKRAETDYNAQPRPVAECWFGTPRKWTHILDEFPGTRTIWFEKTESESTARHGPSPITLVSTESVKRLRENDSTSPASLSPPPKRSQEELKTRRRPLKKTAAGMLAEMAV